jgi:DNA processing protein
MPHHKEKIYLNALNIAFKNNFLKLFPFLSSSQTFKKAWEKLSISQKENINPYKEWQKIEKQKVDFIISSENKYPDLLKEISYPPSSFYIKGEIPKETPCIAIVGTRKVSAYGKLVTEKLVQELVRYNFIIVSGLAYGVDTIAHETALKNQGKTIAVLGSGLNNIYPCSNKRLSHEVAKHGALISEYPLDAPALKSYFPWRNRIISGLSLATVVIEAPEKSGALITAQFALEQNREVFAIPGSIFNKNSVGTNNLIKQGAKLVFQIEDILEELNIQYTLPVIKDAHHLKFDNNQEEKIYQLLSKENSLAIDKIIEMSNLSPKEVLAILTTLELKGFIKNTDGGNYIKNK